MIKISQEFKFGLNLGLKMCLRKRKEEKSFPFSLTLPSFGPLPHLSHRRPSRSRGPRSPLSPLSYSAAARPAPVGPAQQPHRCRVPLPPSRCQLGTAFSLADKPGPAVNRLLPLSYPCRTLLHRDKEVRRRAVFPAILACTRRHPPLK